MSDDRMFERNARAWLELGPTTAPKKAVEAALRTIEATPQERGLRAPWRFPRLTIQTRFAVAAVVALMVVGAGLLIVPNPQDQIGQSSPSPTTSASPSPSPMALEDLQGTWASVGTRADPVFLPNDRLSVEVIAVDAAGLRIDTFKGDVTSSISLGGSGRQLVLRMEAPQDLLTRQHWECITGDTGVYSVSLSPDQQTLSLDSASDECPSRWEILTGQWTRWPCPDAARYAYCDHIGELTPGRYVAPVFKPFDAGSSGQFAYTVPAGWASLSHPPTWPGADSTTRLGLIALDAPDRPAIYVYSHLSLSSSTAVRGAPKLDCPDGLTAPGGTASSVADWLESLSYLTVSRRTPVAIGGLSGVQLDVSLVPGFVDPCSYGSVAGGSVEYSRQVEIFSSGDGQDAIYMDSNGDDHARFIVLDTDTWRLVIALVASGQPALDALVVQAMPVINSFEFIP